MKIKTKLFIIIFTSFLGLILITGLLFLSFREIEQENRNKYALSMILTDIFQMRFINGDISHGNYKRAKPLWDKKSNDILRALMLLRESFTMEQINISNRIIEALQSSNKIIQEQEDSSNNANIDRLESSKSKIDIKLEDMFDDTTKLLNISRQNIQDTLNRSGYIMILIITIAVFSIALNSISIRKALAAPYNSLIDGIKEVKMGNLHHRLSLDGNDEINVLREAVNKMSEQMETNFSFLNSEIVRYKATSELLAKKETTLKSLIEATTDWIWEVDLEGKYTYSSPKTIDMLGYKPEDIIGKKIYDFMSIEKANFLIAGFNKLLESKEPFSGWVIPLVKKDNSIVFVETNGTPIKDNEGKITGFRGINRDITNRHMLQIEKERLINELQSALEKVKMLTGMLPICSSCKKIRNDSGYWQQIESYISEHSEAEFSHSICPECINKLYSKYYNTKEPHP